MLYDEVETNKWNITIMENLFEQKLEGFETYKWISVDDCSEELGVVEEPSFSTSKMERLKESNGRIRRLIDSVSVVGFLLNKKVIEVNNLKNKEMVREIELNQFKNSKLKISSSF